MGWRRGGHTLSFRYLTKDSQPGSNARFLPTTFYVKSAPQWMQILRSNMSVHAAGAKQFNATSTG